MQPQRMCHAGFDPKYSSVWVSSCLDLEEILLGEEMMILVAPWLSFCGFFASIIQLWLHHV